MRAKNPERARKALVRLGVTWIVFLAFAAIALITRSVVVLIVGVIASIVVPTVIRLSGR